MHVLGVSKKGYRRRDAYLYTEWQHCSSWSLTTPPVRGSAVSRIVVGQGDAPLKAVVTILIGAITVLFINDICCMRLNVKLSSTKCQPSEHNITYITLTIPHV